MSDSAHAAGQIPFTINLSEAVTVTGTPRIRMGVSGATRYADYTSGSGTAALTFTYQMVSGDVDADGVHLFSPMELNGGTIVDLHGNAISNLAFAVPNTAGIKVNAAVPNGYTVAINTKDIIGSNQSAFAFNLTYNKTNRTYNYSISSSGGGTPLTGTGTTTGALQTISGINVSSLPDGLLTLSVTLTDSLGGVGAATTDTGSKLTLANMALWLDAANAASITASGGAVSQWNDMSGNSFHLTQGTAGQYPITGTRSLNGKNVVDFDGSDDHIYKTSANLTEFLSGANGATIIQVLQNDSTGGHSLLYRDSVDRLLEITYSSSTIRSVGKFRNSDVQFVSNAGLAAVDTNPVIAALAVERNVTPLLYSNGGNSPSFSDGIPTNNPITPATNQTIQLGLFNTGYSKFNGAIGETLIFSQEN